MAALEDTEVIGQNEYTKSGNYKLSGIQGNIIFDPSSQMPRELMLETTLKAFGFNMDVWEVCNASL